MTKKPRFRKILLALALPACSALMLLAAASSWLGIKGEEHLVRTVAELNGHAGIELRLLEYRRGWFSSRALTELRLALPAAGPLTINHRIWHGPLPLAGRPPESGDRFKPLLAAIDSRLVAPSSLPNPGQLAAAPAPIDVFHANTTITMGGRAETFFRLEPGRQDWQGVARQLNLQWRQLEGHLLFPANLHSMRGELRSPGLALRSADQGPEPPSLLEIKGISLLFNYRREDDGAGGGTLAGSQQLVLSRIHTGGSEHGPLKLEIAWRNLDQRAGGELLGVAPWWPQLLGGGGGREIPPPVAQTLVEALPRLLGKSPVLEIADLRLETPHGAAEGRLRLAYQGRDEARLFHPIMLISGLRLEAEARAPEALPETMFADYQQWPQAEPGANPGLDSTDRGSDPLTALRRRGYLPPPDGSDLVSFSLRYQEGELEINDRPAPIQALFYLFRRS